jgi:hypothetical protein
VPYKTVKATICGWLLLSSICVYAQEGVSVEPVVGMAASYVTKKYTGTKYHPRALPNAGAYVLIPVGQRLALRTGALYQQKGWHSTRAQNVITDQLDLQFRSKVTLHEVAIPMQLSYQTQERNQLQYAFSGGMSYGFLIAAEQVDEVDVYYDGRLDYTSSHSWTPTTGLFPDNSRLKKGDGTRYFMFNAALRIDAGVRWKNKYVLKAFWEQGLNNISAVDQDPASIKVGYCGLQLGVVMR